MMNDTNDRTERESISIAREQLDDAARLPGRSRGLRGAWHRAFRRLYRPYDARRQRLDTALVDSVAGIASELDAAIARAANQAESLKAALTELDGRLSRVANVAEDLSTQVEPLWEHFAARPYVRDPGALSITLPDGSRAMGFADNPTHRGTGGYLAFEDLFRGSEAFIRERLAGYAELAPRGPVLDLGCGRGEFLEVLRVRGIEGEGIDMDPDMVEVCIEKGLSARLADAIEALEAAEPGSIGMIFSAQVIEHMDPSRLRRLLELSLDRLVRDGVLVLETVNPHSARALKTFWLDLTHTKPIFPEALLSIAATVGYESARILFPNGSGELDRDLLQEGEYALVALRGRAEPSPGTAR